MLSEGPYVSSPFFPFSPKFYLFRGVKVDIILSVATRGILNRYGTSVSWVELSLYANDEWRAVSFKDTFVIKNKTFCHKLSSWAEPRKGSNLQNQTPIFHISLLRIIQSNVSNNL